MVSSWALGADSSSISNAGRTAGRTGLAGRTFTDDGLAFEDPETPLTGPHSVVVVDDAQLVVVSGTQVVVVAGVHVVVVIPGVHVVVVVGAQVVVVVGAQVVVVVTLAGVQVVVVMICGAQVVVSSAHGTAAIEPPTGELADAG